MKIFLCDSNEAQVEQCAQLLQRLSVKYGYTVEIEKLYSGNQLIFELDDLSKAADIIFLEINLPGMDGISVARQLRAQGWRSEIIFLTSAKDRVWDAFDVKAFHYMVKGEISSDRFEQIVLSAFKRATRRKSETMVFSCAGESVNVPVSDIEYFEVRNRIITVHYSHTSFEFYSTMTRISEQLANRGFIKVHRSFLVSLNYIQSATTSEIRMMDGTVITVSRAFRKEVKEILTAYSDAHNMKNMKSLHQSFN